MSASPSHRSRSRLCGLGENLSEFELWRLSSAKIRYRDYAIVPIDVKTGARSLESNRMRKCFLPMSHIPATEVVMKPLTRVE
jgi:hypothetical protein